MKSPILTAIDVGTDSIMGVVARRDFSSGRIEVLAKAQAPCFGVRSGEVTKPELVARSIELLKKELSEKSGLKIKQALANIGGGHLFSLNSQGLVSVSRADQKISQEDIQRVLRAAGAVNLPNKEILSVLPREFIIDGEAGIKEPLGLEGIRLETKVLLVCLFSPVLDNLGKAFAEADLQLADVLASPLACSEAVLSEEQKELGAAVLDIGAGTTSLAVFEKGDLVDLAVFPIGSANITNDIAIGLRTEIETAEQIKRQFASLKTAVEPSRKGKAKRKTKAFGTINLQEKELSFPKSFLNNIVQARVGEIFCQAQKALKKIIPSVQLPSGIVLTGGGSQLPGLVEFARDYFKLPCSLGTVKAIPSLSEPQFAVCSGLLLHGFDRGREPGDNLAKQGLRDKVRRIFRIFLP